MLESCKLTAFGLCVKTELLKRGKTQRWLEAKVSEQTGLFMDSSYTYKILTGERSAPKIINAICDILGIAPPADLEGGTSCPS